MNIDDFKDFNEFLSFYINNRYLYKTNFTLEQTFKNMVCDSYNTSTFNYKNIDSRIIRFTFNNKIYSIKSKKYISTEHDVIENIFIYLKQNFITLKTKLKVFL